MCFLIIGLSHYGSAQKLTISGFTDLTFESAFGDPASKKDLNRFELFGGDDELTEEVSRLKFPGFNLIFSSDLSDKLKFQGEIVNSFEEEGGLEIELLRGYADYAINPKFNLQAGKMLSSIGYLNRNQRFYGYLNYSVKTRDLVQKELGFVPLTTVGLKAHGTFDLGSTSSLTYHAVWGGMRGLTPEGSETLSGVEMGDDDSNSPGVQGLLEFLTYVGQTEVIVGFSGYSIGRIKGLAIEDGEEAAFGEEEEDEDEEEEEEGEEVVAMELSERGIAPYIRIDATRFQFLGELHSTVFSDEIGTLDEADYKYTAYSLELVYKAKLAGKSFYPYVRFDSQKIAGKGYHPFFGLELEDGEELEKAYTPSYKEFIVGFAYDVIKNNRIKIEYGRYVEGPFPNSNLKISTAFAF